MKHNQKPCKNTKKVINREKGTKILRGVMPVKTISKNLQSFL